MTHLQTVGGARPGLGTEWVSGCVGSEHCVLELPIYDTRANVGAEGRGWVSEWVGWARGAGGVKWVRAFAVGGERREAGGKFRV